MEIELAPRSSFILNTIVKVSAKFHACNPSLQYLTIRTPAIQVFFWQVMMFVNKEQPTNDTVMTTVIEHFDTVVLQSVPNSRLNTLEKRK